MLLRKLFFLLFLIFNVQSSETNCNKGCLKCSAVSSGRLLEQLPSNLLNETRILQSGEYKCTVCDLAMQYALNGSKCKKLSLEGCVVVAPDGETCLLCDKDNVFNSDLGKCLNVPSTKKVTNCEYYDLDLNCVKCAADYYYTSGTNKCSAVSSKTTGCIYYESSTKCGACDIGYVLQTVGDSSNLVCVNPEAPTTTTETETETTEGAEEPKILPQSCLRKSPYLCTECKSGYFLNYNYQFQMNLEEQDLFLELTMSDVRSKLGILSSAIFKDVASDIAVQTKLTTDPLSFGQYNPCVQGLVKNCLVYSDFDTCKTCDEGYYLADAHSCLKQPVPPISNCSVYVSQSVCSECSNGYYLGTNGEECLEVTKIDGCKSYQGTSNKCGECELETQYVNEVENSCKDRTNTGIEDCTVYQPMEDKCGTCKSGSVLSSSGLACLAIPASCAVYSEVDGSLVCSSCVNQYYLDGNTCTLGTVSNCSQYSQTEVNKCTKCNFKFFINSSGTCTNFSKSVDSNCSDTGNGDNECIGCSGSYFAVSRPNRCVQLQNSNTSLGCASLDTNGSCVECKNNFFGTECQFENNDSTIGCSKFDNNSNDVALSDCIVCNQDTHYLQDKKCFKRHNLSLKNCSISQLDTNECQLCNSDSAPRNAQKITTCVDSNDLSASADVLTKCEVYDVDNSKCQVCKSPYVMDGDNGCVSECPSTKLIAQGLYDEVNGEHVFVGDKCVDKPSNLTNCKTILVQPPNTLICSECATGYLPSYNTFTGSSSSSIAIHNYDSVSETFKGASTFVSIGCVDATLSVGKSSSDVALFTVENCSLYNTTNGSLYCSRCKNGMVGVVAKDKFGNHTISNCVVNESVYNATDFYESISFALNTRANPVLDQSLDALFSVHKCVDTAKIVFLVAKLNSVTSSSKFLLDISDITQSPALISSQTSLNYNLICSDKSELNSSDLDHCILGVFDIENTTEQRHFCVACAPGYRADKFHLNGVYITKCVAITGCDTSTASSKANTCETCTSGVWRYSNSSAQVMFDYCGESSISNCLISDSISNTKCSVCKKGYFLALDKSECLTQTEENCSVKGSDFLFGIDTTLYPVTFSRTLAFLSSLLGSKRGCETCSSGFSKITYNKYLCEKNVNLLEHTISNCSKPMIDSGSLSCIECKEGFIPRQNSKDCVAVTVDASYTNCSLLNESTTNFKPEDNTPIYPCKICNTTHIFDQSNVCSLTKIENCEQQDLDTGKCLKCNENFLLSYEECVAVPDDSLCVKYDNNGNCLQCKTDYELVLIEQSGSGASLTVKTECVITNYQNHCAGGNNKIFYNTASKAFVEECGECLNGYTLVTADGTEHGDSYTKCYPVPYPDANCSQYDSISLQCSSCKSNYYLTTKNSIKTCTAIDPVENCSSYVENTNTCSSCDEGYFLETNTKLCEKNPAGIQNCLQYKSEEECLICQKEYYLGSDGTTCTKVETANIISKCEAYSGATTCQSCESGFLPHNSSSECAAIVENSCLTWKDISNCETCADDKVLKAEGGTDKCVTIDIDNCAKVNPSTFKCSECSPNYYYSSSSDSCTEVTESISNCKVYANEAECSRCNDNYLVNLTGKKCVSITSVTNFPVNNCLVGKEFITEVEGESNPDICHHCDQGYWNQDGTCNQACSDKYCRFCDQSSKSTCDLCVTGFYMDSSGKCLPNEGELEIEDNNEDPDKSTNILSTTVIIWFIVSFLW